jgi:hypothetical protein
LFSNKVEQFELNSVKIADQDQLIKEGNEIFKFLWWKDVLQACKKDVDSHDVIKKFFGSLTKENIMKHLSLLPETNEFVVKKKWVYKLSEKQRTFMRAAVLANQHVERRLVRIDPAKPYDHNFIIFDREFLEKIFSVIETADSQKINLEEVTVLLGPNIISENRNLPEIRVFSDIARA